MSIHLLCLVAPFFGLLTYFVVVRLVDAFLFRDVYRAPRRAD